MSDRNCDNRWGWAPKRDDHRRDDRRGRRDHGGDKGGRECGHR